MRGLLFLGLLSVAFARKTFFGDQVLTIHLENDAQAETIRQLEMKVDFWSPDSVYGIKAGISADVRIPSEILPSVKVMLRRQKIQFEVKIDDVESLVEAQFSGNTKSIQRIHSYDKYNTYDEINTWTKTIDSQYASATRSVIGVSFEGRDIPMLTLGTSNANPAILIDCGIHAREWISPAYCQCLVNALLQEEINDFANSRLRTVTYHIVPVANPDGYAYTWTNDRMWRKTRSTGNGVCIGVDPNRNFDAGWGGEGSSSNTCSEVYYGPSPESEPEVYALSQFMRENIGSIVTYIGFHSYDQFIISPYSYTYALPANNADLLDYAAEGAAAIQSVNNKKFDYGSGAASFYPAAGGSDDYAYDGGKAILAYTVELRDNGRYGFTLPADQIPGVCSEMDAYMKTMHCATIKEAYGSTTC